MLINDDDNAEPAEKASGSGIWNTGKKELQVVAGWWRIVRRNGREMGGWRKGVHTHSSVTFTHY